MNLNDQWRFVIAASKLNLLILYKLYFYSRSFKYVSKEALRQVFQVGSCVFQLYNFDPRGGFKVEAQLDRLTASFLATTENN